ncbi:unnamed protein product, partial [Staurois parvus]
MNVTFCHFLISRRFRPPYVRRSQEPELRRQMPASAGGDGRGRCRRD